MVKNRQKISNTTKAILQVFTSFLPFLTLWTLMHWSLRISYWQTLGLGVLNAFFLVRIFIIQHDCRHQSFLKSRKWNNAIGFGCSFFSRIPYKYWSHSHTFHHANTDMLEFRDIGGADLLTVREYKVLPKWKQVKYRIYRSPFVIFLIGSLYYLFIHNRFPFVNLKG